MKNKILFLLTYYHPHWTGLTAYAQRIAENLTNNHEVTVIAAKHKDNLPQKETHNQVRIIRLKPLLKLSRSLITPSLYLKLIAYRKEYQSVSIQLAYASALPAVILTKILGKKVYLTHNGDLVLPQGLLNKILEKIYYLSTYLAAKLSDGIIAQTKDYANHSKLLSNLPKKTRYIYAPVTMPTPNPEKVSKWKQELGIKDKKIIGFAGRFVEEKGFDYLLRAIPNILEKIPDAVFVFAGEKNISYENFYQQCKPLVEKYKKHIKFLGLIVSKAKMANFYSMLDVFVISSRTDCFPSAQIEAAITGTPLVCTNIPGAREVIKVTGLGEIVEPHSPSALAAGIISVLKNKDKYLKNKQKAKKIFNYQKTIRSYDQLLTN